MRRVLVQERVTDVYDPVMQAMWDDTPGDSLLEDGSDVWGAFDPVPLGDEPLPFGSAVRAAAER